MASTVANLLAANVTISTFHAHGRRSSRVPRRNRWTVTAIATPQIKPVELPRTSPNNWAISFCDHLERKVREWSTTREDARERDDEVKNIRLEGNYAPVGEMAPTAHLPVEGTLPACLNGQFLRNGPNPNFQPAGGYHWFDGDGMIHGLNIIDGKARYAARYVRTSRFLQEERFGASKFVKLADLLGVAGYCFILIEKLRFIFGVLDASNGVGTGNTSLAFHNNKLLALHEQDKPYSMKVMEDGDLQTNKIEDYGQKLNHSFTAHPKIDPITGEMFLIGYEILNAPYLIYQIVSKDGILGEPIPITISRPAMIHDFAISKNYAIFMDTSISCNFKGMARGDFIFKSDMNKKSRIGILPRYATNDSQIQWFDIPTCFISHTVNAWEENGEVVLICCLRERFNLNPLAQSEMDSSFGITSRLHRFKMNLKSGEVKHKQLSNLSVELPQINLEYTSRITLGHVDLKNVYKNNHFGASWSCGSFCWKTKYAYCSVYDDNDKIKGVVKYDLSIEPSLHDSTSKEFKIGGNIVGVFYYGEGRAGEEAIFVPRNSRMEPNSEDDGYLISFVHDAYIGKSEVVVIDAKTMAPNLVAIVRLPRRVPHGFHALFISQDQLQQQT